MTDSKCFFVTLVTLYAQRLNYGYKCNFEKLWKDIVAFRRLILIEENIESCQLRGNVVDDINNMRSRLISEHGIVCRDC